MTYPDRTQRSCLAPSANRYPYCGCVGCLKAYRIKKRQRRRAKSMGDHVCSCGHRFQTVTGLRSHMGKVHPGEVLNTGSQQMPKPAADTVGEHQCWCGHRCLTLRGLQTHRGIAHADEFQAVG